MIEAAVAIFLCTVTDDAGHTLKLNHPAQRIVSLAPDITESLYAAGAGHQVVGVIRGSDYPAAAKTIPQVGSYAGIDLEKMASLHPDLIVTWGAMFPRQLAVLRKLNIPIYVSKPKQLEDIPRTIKNLGCLAGTQHQANAAAESFSKQLSQLQHQYHTQKPVTVFYQIGTYSLLTINHDSWINQVIEQCGGKNIYATLKTPTPEVDWESVVTTNPDVILTDSINPHWQTRWQRWPRMSAVKNKRLFNLPPTLIDRAGPRLLEGAKLVCEHLQSTKNIKQN